MPITERDRNRLAALILLVRPAHSIAARVEKLNTYDRARYEQYSERMKEFIARNDMDEGGNRDNAYAKSLRGYGPQLPNDTATALFGEMPTILKTDDEHTAARKWMEFQDAR